MSNFHYFQTLQNVLINLVYIYRVYVFIFTLGLVVSKRLFENQGVRNHKSEIYKKYSTFFFPVWNYKLNL